MKLLSTPGHASRIRLPRPSATLACAVAMACLVLAPAALGDTASTPATTQLTAVAVGAVTGESSQPTLANGRSTASATLEQCATATIPQTERAATFAGEMTSIPGTARMEIRVDLEERTAAALPYRTVTASGLGVWHSSAAGVKVFAHIQQVTNLSAPASYRGVLRFRWLNAKGRLLKAAVARTASCEQPAPLSEAPSAAGANPAGTGSTGSTGTATTATAS